MARGDRPDGAGLGNWIGRLSAWMPTALAGPALNSGPWNSRYRGRGYAGRSARGACPAPDETAKSRLTQGYVGTFPAQVNMGRARISCEISAVPRSRLRDTLRSDRRPDV